jgi:hypothetical protein
MGEAMSLGALFVNAGYAENVIALTSSHFASAEKQFRYPLEYGNQRPLSATWTVTGSGGVIISSNKSGPCRIKGITKHAARITNTIKSTRIIFFTIFFSLALTCFISAFFSSETVLFIFSDGLAM